MVAVVTGGASGIGRAIVERFINGGARTFVLDVREAPSGEFIRTDVGVDDDVQRAFDEIGRQVGAVDVLVNNAGIVHVGNVEETSVAEWDRVMAVNVRSVFLTAKYGAPLLRAAGQASIVNIGSVSSFVGQARTPAYVASKGAVAMLTKALALDFSTDGIRVNCVCPGITDTPMLREHMSAATDPEAALAARLNRVPSGKILHGADIAGAVWFLASQDAAGITGTTLLVDGGYLAAAEWAGH